MSLLPLLLSLLMRAWKFIVSFIVRAPVLGPTDPEPVTVDVPDPLPAPVGEIPMPITRPEPVLTTDLSDEFFLQGNQLAWNRLRTRFLYLLESMTYESGVRPHAVNPKGAYGLIQLTEAGKGAAGWSGAASDFSSLSAEAQVPYIINYFAQHAPYSSGEDAYATVFLPGRIGDRSPGTVLTRSPEDFYTENKSLDADGKGYITIEDLGRAIARAKKNIGSRWTEIEARNAWAESQLGIPQPMKVSSLVGALFLVGSAWLAYRYV